MIPPDIRAIASGRQVTAVWTNLFGHTTYQVGEGDGRVFVKWVPHGTPGDLAAEAERLRWAVDYIVVPRILGRGANDDAEWMVTAGLTGENAVTDRWKADPGVAVREIGRGLRAIHDSLPVVSCPFVWSVEDRLEHVRSRNDWDTKQWADVHRHLGVERAIELSHETPPVDQLVVCHGDPCAPNTLIGDDGRWTGHVDLGQLGIADRWADLAVATWSAEWNYGPGWDDLILDAYGIDNDPERIAYYRLLWEVEG